jgi:hypothetical protein
VIRHQTSVPRPDLVLEVLRVLAWTMAAAILILGLLPMLVHVAG